MPGERANGRTFVEADVDGCTPDVVRRSLADPARHSSTTIEPVIELHLIKALAGIRRPLLRAGDSITRCLDLDPMGVGLMETSCASSAPP